MNKIKKIFSGFADSKIKIRHYILYALGETIFITIGILIALQVDNWNEDRKEKLQEKAMLNNILNDLRTAKFQSENQIKNDRYQLSLLQSLFDKHKRDSIQRKGIMDSIMYLVIWNAEITIPELQTYSDLKATGRQLIISDNLILDKLRSLEIEIKHLNTLQVDKFTVQQMRIDRMAEKDLNFVKLLTSQKLLTIGYQGEPNDYTEFFKKQDIQNLLAIKMIFTYDVLSARLKLDEQIDELILQLTPYV